MKLKRNDNIDAKIINKIMHLLTVKCSLNFVTFQRVIVYLIRPCLLVIESLKYSIGLTYVTR